MDKSTLKRLNTLRKKLRRWEREGYNVSPLKKDIEAYEKQEGIERRSKAPMVVLITLLILALIGGGIYLGINYHKKGLVYLRTNSKAIKNTKISRMVPS